MTREEVLQAKVDKLNEKQAQLKVRAFRENQKVKQLQERSRGYRKQRTHRLIIVGAELERLAGRELSVEDVREIWAAASAHCEPSLGRNADGYAVR